MKVLPKVRLLDLARDTQKEEIKKLLENINPGMTCIMEYVVSNDVSLGVMNQEVLDQICRAVEPDYDTIFTALSEFLSALGEAEEGIDIVIKPHYAGLKFEGSSMFLMLVVGALNKNNEVIGYFSFGDTTGQYPLSIPSDSPLGGAIGALVDKIESTALEILK